MRATTSSTSTCARTAASTSGRGGRSAPATTSSPSSRSSTRWPPPSGSTRSPSASVCSPPTRGPPGRGKKRRGWPTGIASAPAERSPTRWPRSPARACASFPCCPSACWRRCGRERASLVDRACVNDQRRTPMLSRRRDFLKLTAGLVTSASLAPRILLAQPAVKIGTAVLADYGLAGPVIIAAEKGFFKEQGVNAEFLPFRGGPDLLKAVMVGEGLVGVTGSTHIKPFRLAGPPRPVGATPPAA